MKSYVQAYFLFSDVQSEVWATLKNKSRLFLDRARHGGGVRRVHMLTSAAGALLSRAASSAVARTTSYC